MKLKNFLRLLCHQKRERSHILCGTPLLVCARCLGIYLGFLCTFYVLLVSHGLFTLRLKVPYAVVLFVPLGIDGITQLLKKRESTNRLRFVTGYLGGIGLAFFLYASFSILLGTASSTHLPTQQSLLTMLFLPPLLWLLETHNKKDAPLLKKALNVLTIFAILLIIILLVVMWGWIIVKVLS